jgi:hypothetical protein
MMIGLTLWEKIPEEVCMLMKTSAREGEGPT